MRTDIKVAWCMEFTKIAMDAPKIDLDDIREAGREVGTGILAGTDPSGARVGQLAIDTARGSSDPSVRRRRTGLAMAGGAIGGSVLVPAAMSAIYGGIMGTLGGKGIGGRAWGGVSRAASGVADRLTGIPKGRRGLSVVRKAMDTGQGIPLDEKDLKALQWFAKRAPISAMEGKMIPNLSTLTRLEPDTAAALEVPARSALSDLAAQYTVGGALGAAGAYGHFQRGDQIGKEIEKALHTPVPRKKR